MSEGCIHEFQKDQCADCKPKTGPTWELLYETICSVCWLRMDPGAKVRWSADGTVPVHARR